MRIHATGFNETKTWDEKPYSEIEGGPKLTRASVTRSFHGDIEGEGMVDYLMLYPDDSTASFIGLERVVGSVGGRSGSFVLQQSGTFAGGVAKGTWFVVPGSETGDLRGLRGEGGFVSVSSSRSEITLDYAFE